MERAGIEPVTSGLQSRGTSWLPTRGSSGSREVGWAGLRAPRLGLAHRYATVLVDLHHEATRVVATRETSQAFRASEDDRVGVGARLDREALRALFLKEGVESVLPRANRVDLARHSSA